MTDSVTLLASFGAGTISFLSPCVLPVVPGYLSVVTGLDLAELEEGRRSHLLRIARDTSLFILGFGSVFVLLGIGASGIGSVLIDNQALLTRLSGAVVLFMALFIIGSFTLQAPWLYGEKRFHPDLSRFGRVASPVAGVAFGFGWTPCVGPTLTSVLALAAAGGTNRAIVLLTAYSLGLGIPFLIVGLAFGRLSGAMAFLQRRLKEFTMGSAGLMAVSGFVLMFGWLPRVTGWVIDFQNAVGLGGLLELG
ncbi:MAG: cytochrome c biogenesis protein CcdA [Acidimicrobiales bacterium]